MKKNALHFCDLSANKTLIISRFILRIALLILLAGVTSFCFSQTTLLNESFGTGTAFPTGWTTSSSTDWTAVATNSSTGYTGASGGTNAFFGPTNTTPKTLIYSNNLSTVGYNNISILWGGRYITSPSTNYTINLVLSWSADSATWNNVTFTNVPLQVTPGLWSLVNGGTPIALPAGAAGIPNLRIRFTATSSSSSANSMNTIYRLDDVTIQGCPASAGSISYSGTPFCKSIATAQAVTPSTVTGGTYSSTTGLSIDATTGAITPSTSTAGTYTVIYTLPCGTATTTTVTITAVPAATIAYAGTPFCSSISAAQAVTLTGTTGGTFSSTTGLTINASTGAITPNTSTAGTYTVTYTVAAAGGCSAFSTTASVTITTAPSATISYTGTPYCKSVTAAQAVTLTGTTGGTYSSTAGLTINATTGAITPSTSTTGTYTVTYTIAASGGCAVYTTTTSVVIADLPTVSGTSTETCVGGSTGTITATATGGTSPYNYSLNAGAYQASATFTGLAAATYTLNAKTSAGCTASASVTVSRYANSTDDQTITATDSWIGHAYDGTNFIDYIGRFTETELFNESFGGNTNCFSVTSSAGTRTIYTETFSTKLRMNSTKKGLYTVNLGADDGHRLTIDGTLMYNRFTDAAYAIKSNVLMKLTGSSTLLYEYYENAGANQVSFQGLTLLLANNLTTNTSQNICISGNAGQAISGDAFGTLPTGITLSGTGYQWSYSTTPGGARTNIAGATSATLTPATNTAPFNTAGMYYVYRNAALSSTNNTGFATYVATHESNAATITIVAAPAATISYTASPYCSSAGSASVTQTGTSGGTYSSTSGLSIDATTGTIALSSSTAGTYTVTYTVAASGGCSAFTTTASVTITAPSSATISYSGTPFCTSTTAAQAVNRTGTSGGTYSSTTGLSINSTTGDITPNTSTGGTYTVTYTVAASGGCSTFTTTTSVTITTAPSASITYAGSPFCSDAGTATITQSGTTGGLYSSTTGLSINSSTGAVNINASTASTYTITYTVAAAGGCSQYQTTTSIIIKTAGVWTGALSNDYDNAQNWLCGSVPSTITDITIPAGLSIYPVVTATDALNNLSIASGASITIKGILKVAGAITNNGTFSATDGTIEFNGSTAQQINAGLFDSAFVKNLTINNTAGVTLSTTLNLTGVLKINAGQLNTGDKLVLKSTATGTAMVGTITSSATTPVNGKVTVERYVPGRRKYRLITSGVTTSTATTLTAGQESLSIWGAWQNSGNNTTAGNGTFITGGSSADGFDPQTTNASLLTYDDANRRFVGFTTANGKNTKYTPLKAGTAYYMFVYGDRTNTITTSTPNNTVLSATGTLLTGNQSYTTASAMPLSPVVGRFTFLGNPFVSAINWATIPKTNLDNAYWGWDPNLSNTGGYITVLTSGTVTLQAPYTGSTGLNQYIQPGQGFFVKTAASSPTLTIREQDKVTNFNANAFRVSSIDNMALLAINLYYPNGSNKVLADGVLAAFDNAIDSTSDQPDATKLVNSTENIAILKDTAWLSIHTQPLPRNNDTLLLNVWRLTKPQYILQIFAQQLAGHGTQAFLYDKYVDSLRPLSLTDTNNVVFNVIPGVAASSDTNRFLIVFRTTSTLLAVQFVSIQAKAINRNVQVNWEVANEVGIQRYEIERATDGITFIQAGIVNAKGNNSSVNYEWIDNKPASGNNYYRVRAVQKDGTFVMSKTVLVKMTTGNLSINIFPNPVTGNQITIHSTEMEKGKYHISVINAQGQKMLYKNINHVGGIFNQTIRFDKNLAAGLYQLKIENGIQKNNQPFFVQ